MSEVRTDVIGPYAPVSGTTTGSRVEIFAVEIAELALILAGLPDDDCVEMLKAVKADLEGTDLVVDFFVAVMNRKSALEQTTMTAELQ
jgi:hypothetical protein